MRKWNYGVTGPNFIKFVLDVGQFNALQSLPIGVPIFQSVSERQRDK